MGSGNAWEGTFAPSVSAECVHMDALMHGCQWFQIWPYVSCEEIGMEVCLSPQQSGNIAVVNYKGSTLLSNYGFSSANLNQVVNQCKWKPSTDFVSL